MAEKVKRVTVSLPPDVVDKLDFISERLRISRSALLSVMLNESVGPLVEMASSLPPPDQEPTAVDVRRFRGTSARVIGNTVSDLLAGGFHDDSKD